MRSLLLFLACMASAQVYAQDILLINELQAANHGTIADGAGLTHDWVEVFNPGPAPVDLQGMRLISGLRQHHFRHALIVPPGGHRILWCSGLQGDGAHVSFKLPRSGGSLLLIATDGTTILDMFTWTALESGISMGRLPDGGKAWSYFPTPTPGAANRTDHARRERTSVPVAEPTAGHFATPINAQLKGDDGVVIYYTMDGSAPDTMSSFRYEGPIAMDANTVLRARAFAVGHIPGPELHGLYTFGSQHPHPLSLALSPEALYDGKRGIDTPGLHQNHTRDGKAWERAASVSLPYAPEGAGVGIRIAGSGSRGLAKRSYKLYARSRYDSPDKGIPFPDGSYHDEAMLRADASPHAFLRNRLMEILVTRHGLHVDVQPSTPVTLYLNGRYRGLYRLMPPKDAQWLRRISGAGSVDVVEGPASNTLSGRGADHRSALELLVNGAPLEELGTRIDMSSLIDLAALDLYMGRADHDLNVRAHRPRETGGLWRWVLFDMDLWAPAAENSVERMCSATVPETPFVPQLLAHPELRPLLLARITALQAAVFAPAQVRRIADSLYHAHEDALLADHRRWELELGNPHPVESSKAMDAFLNERPAHLMRHLARKSGHPLRSVRIDVPPADQARILIEGLELAPGRHEVRCFAGVPVRMEAIPAVGHEFAGWKGADDAGRVFTMDAGRTSLLRAMFRPVLP